MAGLPATPWVREFLDAWDSGRYRFFMLEWARRHRKTTSGINILIRDCVEYPNWVSLFVAPFLKQAREIIWDDPKMLFKWLPDKSLITWDKNEVKLMIRFENGSILRLAGADKLERGRGIDCNDLFLDEFSYDDPDVWPKIFMPIMAGVSKVPRRTLFGFTPCGENHATDLFDWAMRRSEPGQDLPVCGAGGVHQPGWWSSRVVNDSTQFLDSEFLVQCRDQWPQQLYDQEINCARVTSEEMTLITSEMLHELNQRLTGVVVDADEFRRIVSIDPAFGGDVCMIMGIENGSVKIEEGLRDKHNIGEIVMAAKLVAQRLGTKNFIVDDIGNNVADLLKTDEAMYDVQCFNGAESAGPDDIKELLQFANKRAASYCYTAERIRRFDLAPVTSRHLMRGLPIASRFTVTSKNKIILQPKAAIKKVLGRSPDEEDCFTMGVWGSQYVMAGNWVSRRFRKDYRPMSPMA